MSDKGTIVSTTTGLSVAGYGAWTLQEWLAVVGGTVAILSLLINWYYKRKQYLIRLRQDERQELRFQWEQEQARREADRQNGNGNGNGQR